MKKIILVLGAITTIVSANSRAVENESYSHEQRILILQEADACIKNSTSKAEYQACEEKETASRQALKNEMKKKKLGQMDEKIKNMTDGKRKDRMVNMRNCLSDASTKEDHKQCKAKYGKKRKNS